MSTFGGLELTKRALQSQQGALEVTGHNIANANTKGYSRQEATMSATRPHTIPGMNQAVGAGQRGTGVEIKEVARVRDRFIDAQINKEKSEKGYWDTQKESLNHIEMVFAEPSDNGLRNAMDEFWGSLQELSAEPESNAVRATVRQKGTVMSDTFNHLDTQLDDYQQEINGRIDTKLDDINSYGRRIADINARIKNVEVSGDNANDLRDQRDLLIEELSEITNVDSREDSRSSVSVSISGHKLVSDESYNELELVVNRREDVTSNYIEWDDGNKARFSNGELKSLLDTRDEDIPNYREQLDTMASTLVEEFNQQHQAGYDREGNAGENFFASVSELEGHDQITAANIKLSDNITAKEGTSKIAASANGAVGDGDNALELFKLSNEKILDDGNVDLGDYYNSNIAQLGIDGQRADRMVDNQDKLIKNLKQQRDSVSGVSLDEEMTKLVKYQHAYGAAARVTSSLNDMFETLLHRI